MHESRDYALLTALEIPTACRTKTTAADRALAAEFLCCTQCHSAKSRVESTERAILKSSTACAGCHDGLLDEVLSVAPRRLGPAIEYDRMRWRFHEEFRANELVLGAIARC